MKLRKPTSKLLFTGAVALACLACSEQKPSADRVSSEASKVSSEASKVPEFWPRLDQALAPNAALESRIADLLRQMTPEQKVAQMIQPEIRDITVEDMRQYGFGSYLNGGGSFPEGNKHATPADWIALADAMYQASIDDSLDGSNIPTMWGTDAVHGHNNVIGATLFPHNIGLGASNNPALIEQIASATAREVMVTGIDWVFAPTVAVVRDDRWGRSYEGYSEDPEIVRAYSNAIVKGLQGHVGPDFLGDRQVISSIKHFLGDGGTEGGDDQGNNTASEEALFSIHAQGYVGGLTAGAQTVMASFNSWNGDKIHGNRYLLTEVLKQRMGFDGLVVGDWNGHGQIENCTIESCSQAAMAGLDIYMAPTESWKPLYENTLAQVKSGEITQERVDDAVSRILRVKLRAGLFNKPSPAERPLSGKQGVIGSSEHRAIARQAVRESLVLLKNNDALLPLSPAQNILVSGSGADNIGQQSGGWSITWQGTGNQNSDFPGATSIYAGINEAVKAAGGQTELNIEGDYQNKPDLAIVVFGEQPYAEGNGDLDNLEFQRDNKSDLALLKKLQADGIKVVSIFITGRPLWINPELNASDAFVVAWLPGSEGQGVADVLFKTKSGEIAHDFSGKLSFSWPATPQQIVNRFDEDYQPLLPYGYGLQYGESNQLTSNLSEEVEAESGTLSTLAIFDRAVKSPWKLWLNHKGESEQITSNTQSLETLAIRTIDRRVQEDALNLEFSQGNAVSFSIKSDFPSDLRSYLEGNASLQVDFKVNVPATQPVFIGMDCANECDGSELEISDTLTASAQGQWQTLNIALSCFKNAGADFAKIFTPFKLTTQGALNISVSDVRIEPGSAEAADFQCE